MRAAQQDPPLIESSNDDCPPGAFPRGERSRRIPESRQPARRDSLPGFRYLADPICIAALIIYPINRFVLKPHHIGGWFTHGYLNDVLCLPLFVPMILYFEHIIGLRKGRDFPRVWEIFQNFVAFTIVFQVITPRFPKTFITASDPWDILAYFIGGALAGWYWHVAKKKDG